ncbi:glycosyltransferase family 4 protein [Albibacillus kandeliae]|uniref:glycosyltransferase family 4 protein n=1 Tax=Albibacillus kandeliae TaxID=2174228 RepID=UPI000D69AF71|nr:glycosyltransferase family 4 protein [Albibacillus kandeliae]
MKVILSTVGRFHIFPLASELEKQGVLERVYSGFPWRHLSREGVSREKVRTFPWVRPLLMGARHLPFPLPSSVVDWLHLVSVLTLDRYVALTLPEADIYVGHEAVGLISGAAAQNRGMVYICDRGCTHMAWRERTINEERARFGLPAQKRPKTYEREIAEYAEADFIVLPSQIAKRSFLEEGVEEQKLVVVPYGVNLDKFRPEGQPDASGFDVLFVGGLSIRKGAQDLLDGFRAMPVAGKRLRIVGSVTEEAKLLLGEKLNQPDIELVGHVDHWKLKRVMSESHVLVLPSIEDGFGMVVPEAMACGCPAIVSENAGAADIICDGQNGYVVPIRRPDLISEKLQLLAQDPALRETMSQEALNTVQTLGGWEDYGNKMFNVYKTTLAQRLS